MCVCRLAGQENPGITNAAETRPRARGTRVKQGQNEGFRLPQPNASMGT